MFHPHGLPAELSALDRTLVMGVINVTPDSFSDGGKYLQATTAVEEGLLMMKYGADIIDIGGESTRPGAERISVDEELSRVLPVIQELVSEGAVISIDTMRTEVARAAIDAGAAIVNDISGGKSDDEMLPYVANLDVPYILMHWRGPSNVMQQLTDYTNVACEVAREISDQVDVAVAAGVNRNRIVVDPGIGFAKTPEQNWPILQDLEAIDDLELPVLWGVSRKRFLGELLADTNGELREVTLREDATTALSTYLALAGAWCVRVHDVRASRDAIEVVDRLGRIND